LLASPEEKKTAYALHVSLSSILSEMRDDGLHTTAQRKKAFAFSWLLSNQDAKSQPQRNASRPDKHFSQQSESLAAAPISVSINALYCRGAAKGTREAP
jgi:hypothetical protein